MKKLIVLKTLFFILILSISSLSVSANANDVTISNVSWKDLPFADAIKIKKGNGLRKIAVISDPRCKGCRMFSHELEQLDNLTIYIFPRVIFLWFG